METKRDSLGRKKRSRNKTVEIKIPKDTVKKKLLAYDVVEIKKHNGKEIWKPKARPELNFNDDWKFYAGIILKLEDCTIISA